MSVPAASEPGECGQCVSLKGARPVPSHGLFLLTGQRSHLFFKCCLVLGRSALGEAPRRPHSHWGRAGKTGPEVCQPNLHHNQQAFGPCSTETLKTLVPWSQALEADWSPPESPSPSPGTRTEERSPPLSRGDFSRDQQTLLPSCTRYR